MRNSIHRYTSAAMVEPDTAEGSDMCSKCSKSGILPGLAPPLHIGIKYVFKPDFSSVCCMPSTCRLGRISIFESVSMATVGPLPGCPPKTPGFCLLSPCQRWLRAGRVSFVGLAGTSGGGWNNKIDITYCLQTRALPFYRRGFICFTHI